MNPETTSGPSTASQADAPTNTTRLLTEFDAPDFDGASATSSIETARFDQAYHARPPWDIDGPQPDLVRILDAGLIRGRVLDIGCGTGENALHFAGRGLEVTGLDASIVAISRAQAKARSRRLSARFIHGDALHLAKLGETFDTVTDSGLLHVLSDQQMQQLIAGVHTVLRPSGHYWLMCFSEHATVPGPRRLTQQHLTTLFSDGWKIQSIHPARFEVIAGRGYDHTTAGAWLAGLERLPFPTQSQVRGSAPSRAAGPPHHPRHVAHRGSTTAFQPTFSAPSAPPSTITPLRTTSEPARRS